MKLRGSVGIGAALCMTVLLGHMQPCVAAEVDVRFGVLHLKGRLEAGDRDQVAKALGENKVRKIAVTSEGGDISAAIEVATLLRSVAIPMEVRHYCLSACASYLLYGAQQINFGENVFIGFHAGAALNRVFASRALRDTPSILDGNPDRALLERFVLESDEGAHENMLRVEEFSRLFNVDKKSIAFYVAMTLPRAIDKVKLWEAADGTPKYALEGTYQCAYWAPSPADLRRLGLAIGEAPDKIDPHTVARRIGFREPICTFAYQPQALRGTLEQIVSDPAGKARSDG